MNYGSSKDTDEILTNAFIDLTDNKLEINEDLIRICNSADYCIENMISFAEYLNEVMKMKCENENEINKVEDMVERVKNVSGKVNVYIFFHIYFFFFLFIFIDFTY